MKTKATPDNDLRVVYRKDGVTPDMRYNSSKIYVLAESMEKNKARATHDLQYKSFRDHSSSKNTEISKIHPVQIKPVGKKPVWRVNG